MRNKPQTLNYFLFIVLKEKQFLLCMPKFKAVNPHYADQNSKIEKDCKQDSTQCVCTHNRKCVINPN